MDTFAQYNHGNNFYLLILNALWTETVCCSIRFFELCTVQNISIIILEGKLLPPAQSVVSPALNTVQGGQAVCIELF